MLAEEEACFFGGTSHPELARSISEHARIKLGKMHVDTFPDGEIFVRIEQSVRGRDVFVLQSPARRPNHYLMELLVIIDALRRASAGSVNVLIPYYAYSRQDRKDTGRVPITARLVANLMERAGASRILTMDLHADQIQGFFDIPTDNLAAEAEWVKVIEPLGLKNLVVGAPDIGSLRSAKRVADRLHADIAVIDKRRFDSRSVSLSPMIGTVKGKNVLLVDDICSTGNTLHKAVLSCKEEGAEEVYALITHALFVSGALEKLENTPVKKIYITDTVPQNGRNKHPKIEEISIAGLFGEAVRSVLDKNSISSLCNR